MFDNGRYVDDAGDIGSAAADKRSNARRFTADIRFCGDFFLLRQCPAGLGQAASGGTGGSAGFNDRGRYILGGFKSPSDKNAGPGGLHRFKAVRCCKTI
jgi:hypothetical protein